MRIMRKMFVLLSLMLALTFFVVGCGKKNDENTSTKEDPKVQETTTAVTDSKNPEGTDTATTAEAEGVAAEVAENLPQTSEIDLSTITKDQLMSLLGEMPEQIKTKLQADKTFREGANKIRDWGYALDTADSIEQIWALLQYRGDITEHINFLNRNLSDRIVSASAPESESSLWQYEGKGYGINFESTTFNDKPVIEYKIDTNRSTTQLLYEKDLLQTRFFVPDPEYKTLVQGVAFADNLMERGCFYCANLYSTRSKEEAANRFDEMFANMSGYSKTQNNDGTLIIKAKTVEEELYSFMSIEIVIYSTEGRNIDFGDGNEYLSQILIQVRA